ncbi:MAG: NifB/NifX family molybdenum-iron cluster-binding protein [Candidatus Omnitrophota bacterium]
MKIVISTDQDYVSGHFGRCPVFTLVDIQNGEVVRQETLTNPGHMPGVIPKFLKEKGTDCIIAGGMGARAQGLFQQFGIKTVVGVQGKIDETIVKLLEGTLEPGESLCQPGGGKGYGLDKTECDHPQQDGCEHEGV